MAVMPNKDMTNPAIILRNLKMILSMYLCSVLSHIFFMWRLLYVTEYIKCGGQDTSVMLMGFYTQPFNHFPYDNG